MTMINDKPPPKLELQNEITEENLIKEGKELGLIFSSLKEIRKLKIDEKSDQQSAIPCLEYKVKVKNFLLQKDDLLTDDEFIDTFDIKSSSTNEITEFVSKAIDRICTLKGDGNHVGANVLENKLIEKTKGKVKKTLIEREIVKQLQILYPNEYKYSFQVLGFMGRQSRIIVIWHNKAIYTIASKSVANPYDLKLLFGKEIDTDHVAQFIVEEAHKKGELENHIELKSGVWRFDEDDEWLIVSSGEILKFSKNNIESLSSPLYKKTLINCDSNWIAIDELQAQFKTNSDKLQQLKDVFFIIHEHINRWTFKHESMADYLTAFIILMLVQSGMSWRPWLYLLGIAGSGKSTFLKKIIKPIYGELLKKLDKTTPFCVAQSVGNTTKILAFDEFEKNERIPDIVEFCKLMNAGGNKTMGTLDTKEKSYSVCQMPVFASIYPPTTINSDEAQRSRTIFFELSIKRKKYGAIEGISSKEGQKIRIKLIDSMVSLWTEIEKKAQEIKSDTENIIKERNNKISPRTVENFQYASAVLFLITGKEHSVPSWAEQEQINDGRYIFDRLMDSKIQEHGKNYLVMNLINYVVEDGILNRELDQKSSQLLLQQNGISVIRSKTEGDWIGIDPIEAKHLLKRFEELKYACIKTALLEMPNSKWKQARFQSKVKWCVHIPIDQVDI